MESKYIIWEEEGVESRERVRRSRIQGETVIYL